MSEVHDRPSRHPAPDERYRLYIDESGDHVFRQLDDPAHRYLCLLGCWFSGADYRTFHARLEAFKQRHIPHNPDEPVVLHREDVMNARGAFWRLRDPSRRLAFDDDLCALITHSEFRVVGVVIDKKLHRERYGEDAAHPYHLALGFMLQRYCGLLNHISREGDVLAESRGGREDRLLKDSYHRAYRSGAWIKRAPFFQRALTSEELKLKPKSANVAGLQLADILAYPVRQSILLENERIADPLSPFAMRLMDVAAAKFNRQLYDGRVVGYGKVLFPK
jgi:hypothetical protein